MSTESIAVILFALVLGSLIKGLSGLGLPLIAIPLMAGFLGVEQTVVLMTIPGFFVNCWLLWTYRTEAVSLPNLPLVISIGIVGAVSGAWVLATVPERWLLIFLAAWLGLYLLSVAAKKELRLDGPWGRRLSLVVILFGGLVQGATGASGPVVAPYFHAMRLSRGAYVFAITVLFQTFNVTAFVTFVSLGLMTQQRFYEGLLACLPVAIVLPLAVRWSHRFSARSYDMMIVGILVLMEARLIYKALT